MLFEGFKPLPFPQIESPTSNGLTDIIKQNQPQCIDQKKSLMKKMQRAALRNADKNKKLEYKRVSKLMTKAGKKQYNCQTDFHNPPESAYLQEKAIGYCY